MKLDPIDEMIKLSEGQERSLDCILFVELPALELSKLKEGAKKAQATFPKTSSAEVKIITGEDLEAFVNRPLESPFHLEQLVTPEGLALKMSHVLGDAVSMILWLEVQLRNSGVDPELELHRFPPKKDTSFRSLWPSQPWPSSGRVSPQRSFYTTSITHRLSYGEFSLNDLLSLALLNSLPQTRKALWIPVNVRKKSWAGFGNGLSRMRLYPSAEGTTVIEGLLHIRKQKTEAWKSGEIFLPDQSLKLDSGAKKFALKLWLKRPWADWGTLSFSHLHDKRNFTDFSKVWGITNIPSKHQAGIFAFTKGCETTITVTWDPLACQKHEVFNLLNSFTTNFEELERSFP